MNKSLILLAACLIIAARSAPPISGWRRPPCRAKYVPRAMLT